MKLAMMVRLKNDLPLNRRPRSLSFGIEYRVLGISNESFRLLSDDDDPILYSMNLFEVIDPTEPDDWVSIFGESGERYARPRCFERSTWEKYHDYDPAARKLVWDYLATLGPCRIRRTD